ncbi:hypothetical protein ElyMa_004705400 [Elysia marginata]|uniref:Secreted protein n=1 Tax=Elysia marginata TaxID=1093978 RepID=A0AAV4I7U8_9GAST|nr:hypothetical protein ElyMa_004705400 [Elysia marginata]
MAYSGIKVVVWKREVSSIAFFPFNCAVLAGGYCEHIRIQVQARNVSCRTCTVLDFPGENTSTTGHIKDTLPCLNTGGVSNTWRPLRK